MKIGEVVLMECNGWLQAFKVVGMHSVYADDETETVEYQLVRA